MNATDSATALRKRCLPFTTLRATRDVMLRLFGPDCSPKPVDPSTCDTLPETAVWIDLLDPTPDEEKLAEKLVGANIPTRAELSEIEPSSRLYQTRKATFLTMSVLFGISDGQPASDPIGFVLTERHIVSVRYIDPKPFIIFAEHVYAEPDIAKNPRGLLVRLLDAIIDRLADEFEAAGQEGEAISKQIFDHRTHRVHRAERRPALRLEALLMRIGKAQVLLTKLRETSVSSTRLLTFLEASDAMASEDSAKRHVASLVADANALNDHSSFLGDNLTFLLDATLGLISLEQNHVMKIFSMVAVVFMPPTLIAGIYGMNFEHMPELGWPLGYPFALALIVAAAILPYWLARRRGWF